MADKLAANFFCPKPKRHRKLRLTLERFIEIVLSSNNFGGAMALDIKQLEEHLNLLKVRLEEITNEEWDLEEAISATETLIEVERKRLGLPEPKAEPEPAPVKSVSDAVREFFAKHATAENWYTVQKVTDVLLNGGFPPSDSLYQGVGMAMGAMYKSGELERKDVSETRTPKYAYSRKK